jgi:opacity protein-like surface antigen
MRKAILLAFFICALCTFASAQTFSNGEFFGGYTNERVQNADNVSLFTSNSSNTNITNLGSNDRFSTNGFDFEGTGYFTRTKSAIGITGDISGTYRTENNSFSFTGANGTFRNRLQFYNFLAGPQYKFRSNSRVEPFARVLFGVAHVRNGVSSSTTTTTGTTTSTTTSSFNDNTTDFAMAVGGGLDVGVSDRVAVRVFQFDYNPVFQRDRTVSNPFGTGNFTINGQRQDNLRFAVGIVLK